ncbi:MAG: site-specific DNA-methyltransferase [Bacteroidales bacterium]|nr:site-specific DNA-methyltransferase [Bacteroidales bacterium]
MEENLLIHGENCESLKYLINNGLSGKIDLVYIDPPYATGADFTVSDDRANTVSNSKNGIVAYSDKLKGQDFLDFLEKRLFLLKELLSEKGSIYLHIDYKIGHYVKVLMDKVFGIDNFRSDISRIKCNPKNFKRIGYGNIKDMVLFYTKGEKPIWNEPKEKYSEKDLEKLFPKTDKDGRRYTTVPIHAPGETLNPQTFKGMLPPKGRHWRTDVETLEEWDSAGLIEWSSKGNPRKIIFADEQEGKRMQDIWEFKDPQYPDYPTEKNLDMLKSIVSTSSNTQSIVLDCFCGSGTTLLAAQLLDRKWIGIDQSETAISVTEKRLGEINTGLFAAVPCYKKLDFSENKIYKYA